MAEGSRSPIQRRCSIIYTIDAYITFQIVHILVPTLLVSSHNLAFTFYSSLQGGDGGVIKEIVQPGFGMDRPEKGDKVTGKHYVHISTLSSQFP